MINKKHVFVFLYQIYQVRPETGRTGSVSLAIPTLFLVSPDKHVSLISKDLACFSKLIEPESHNLSADICQEIFFLIITYKVISPVQSIKAIWSKDA